MVRDTFVRLYVNDEPQVIDGVVTIDEAGNDCASTLEAIVKLPIRLPTVLDYTWNFLTKNRGKLEETFAAIAKEMGIKEVVIPRIDGCRLTTENVGIDELRLDIGTVDLWRGLFTHIGEIITIHINGIVVPLAWIRGRGAEYMNRLRSVLETALFMNMNPWALDALTKTLDKLLGNSLSTSAIVTNLINVLKLIGAEIR